MIYLAATKNAKGWDVAVIQKLSERNPPTLHALTRVSPLFALTQAHDSTIPAVAPTHIDFIFGGPKTAKICAALISGLPPGIANLYWTSLGQASIVRIGGALMAEEQRFFAEVLPSMGVGAERWEKQQSEWVTGVRPFSVPAPGQENLDSLAKNVAFLRTLEVNKEIDWLAHEVAQGLSSTIAHALQYSPWRIPAYAEILTATVADITRFSECVRRSDDLSICNQIRADLVQLNASLAYAQSQEYSGVYPILENPCPIQMHSLLGAGNACNGLCAFTHALETVFSKWQVADIIASTAFGAGNFDPVAKFLLQEKAGEGRASDSLLSAFAAESSKRVRPKLVHFSGRLGFRETEYAVTAALNAIQGATTAEWSILTLSHEMLHGHVRGLLSAIFPMDPSSNADFSTSTTCVRFCEWLRSPESFKINGAREAVAFTLLNFCHHKSVMANGPGLQGLGKSTPAQITAAFEREYRILNEILVHVLDLLYLHEGVSEGYVGPLWVSWSPVPSVWANTEEYLMRTLAAVGVMQDGPEMKSRMEASIKVVLEELKKLPLDGEYHQTIRRAISILEQPKFTTGRLFEFALNQKLADCAKRYLHLPKISSDLLRDKLLVDTEGKRRYSLENRQYVDCGIDSPVCYVRDVTMQRAFASKVPTSCSQSEAAWLFAVAASNLDQQRDQACPDI
jgi:hypothetical protein